MPEQNLRNEYATQLGEIGKMLVQSETVHKLYCWEWVGGLVGGPDKKRQSASPELKLVGSFTCT